MDQEKAYKIILKYGILKYLLNLADYSIYSNRLLNLLKPITQFTQEPTFGLEIPSPYRINPVILP